MKKKKRLHKPESETKRDYIVLNKNQFREQTDKEEKLIEPMRYGSHQVTAVAIPVKEEKDSIFSKSRKGIYDICLLYNFFTGQNACLEEDRDKFTHLNKSGIILVREPEFTVEYLIAIAEALKRLEKWNIEEKDKEILAFLFLLDARDSKGLQLHFIEEFVCFEILEPEGRNIKHNCHESNFRGKIFDEYNFQKEIKNFNKNDFKEIISVIRNLYVHKGKCVLSSFREEIINRNQSSKKLKKYIDSMEEKNFGQFKIDTWCPVMDYLLSRIFIEILGIADKVSKINKYYFKKVNNYFRKIYN
jgi:hypothetical protein